MSFVSRSINTPFKRGDSRPTINQPIRLNTMNNSTLIANREHWLIECANLLETMVLMPAINQLGEQLPAPLKYSVSMGNTQSKGSIGECWRKSQADDKTTSHIFISPTLNDSVRVADVLLHEMIHAADDCESGHQNFFARVARKCGLVGKLTATKAGDQLREKILDIVDVIGEVPHVKLELSGTIKPKQKARMLKIECQECAFTFRASRTQLMRIAADGCCPCCQSSITNEVQQTVLAAQ